ncbi:MAG TPA: hypothetical protein VGD56_11315 [Gemmatirosa sp.]
MSLTSDSTGFFSADLADPAAPYRPDLPATRDRASTLAAAARARLRTACADWPADQFAALVADVVRFRERWDGSAPLLR